MLLLDSVYCSPESLLLLATNILVLLLLLSQFVELSYAEVYLKADLFPTQVSSDCSIIKLDYQ